MGYRRKERQRKEKTLQKRASQEKKKYDKEMENVKVVWVPHPTIPRTMIQKIIK